MSSSILHQSILAMALLLVLRQRSDVFWLAPLLLSVFLSDKAQIVAILLAESVMFFEIQRTRWPHYSAAQNLLAAFGALCLLCAGILPFQPEFQLYALILYVFLRVIGLPPGKDRDQDPHNQNFHLLLAVVAWSVLGRQLAQPIDYVLGGVMALVAIWGLMVGSPRQSGIALILAIQFLFGPLGALGAVGATLLLAGPAAHALGSVCCSLLVLFTASSLPEPFSWIVGAVFISLMGITRAKIAIPALRELNFRTDPQSSGRNLFSFIIVILGLYSSTIIEAIFPPLFFLLILLPCLEWLARRYREKIPVLSLDKANDLVAKKLSNMFGHRIPKLEEAQPGGFNLSYRPSLRFVGWVEKESVGFAVAAIIVWSLWTWLY